MDTTDEYIGMCQEADEIQKLWKWRIGDCYRNNVLNETHIADDNNLSGRWDSTYSRSTWLPKQDQLQKMVRIHTISEVKEVIEDCEFTEDVDDIRHTKYDNFKSLEMFWLAYVMHEKFEKSWTGVEWI